MARSSNDPVAGGLIVEQLHAAIDGRGRHERLLFDPAANGERDLADGPLRIVVREMHHLEGLQQVGQGCASAALAGVQRARTLQRPQLRCPELRNKWTCAEAGRGSASGSSSSVA